MSQSPGVFGHRWVRHHRSHFAGVSRSDRQHFLVRGIGAERVFDFQLRGNKLLIRAVARQSQRRLWAQTSLGFVAVHLRRSLSFVGLATALWVLFLGRLLTGITSATYAIANALIADVSTPKDKAQNFGLMGVAFGLGFIVGPALGGIIGAWEVRAPFFIAASLAFLAATDWCFSAKPWHLKITSPLNLNAQTLETLFANCASTHC